MTNHQVIYFFVFSTIWLCIRHFYRNTVKPVLLDKARFQIFAVRDEARRLECSQKFSEEEHEAFRFMEYVFGAAIRQSDQLFLTGYLYCSIRNKIKNPKKTERFEQFEKTAPECLRRLDKRFVSAFLLLSTINSPLLALICYLFYRIVKTLEKLPGAESPGMEPVSEKMKRDAKIYSHAAASDEHYSSTQPAKFVFG